MNWFVPEWIVAFALTVFIVDIFLTTELLSWGGVLLLSIWLTWRIAPPFKWCILVFIGSLLLCSCFYYFLMRNVIRTFVRRIIQGKAPEEGIFAITGKIGVLHKVDGKVFIFIDGEMWPVATRCSNLPEDVSVIVDAIEGGAAVVRAIGNGTDR